MININLNNLSFRQEVFQIFSLYFPFRKIEFSEKDASFIVTIESNCIFCEDEKKKQSWEINDGAPLKEQIKKAVFLFLKTITNKIIPWGILTGIRPSKIASSLLDEKYSNDEIIKFYMEHYYCDQQKAELCLKVAKMEKRLLHAEKDTISVYVGMPFCPTRCVYCSFASNPIASCKGLVDPYISSLIHEIECLGQYIKEKKLKLENLYFGGGTPTSIDNEQFHQLMTKIYDNFVKNADVKEFTLECGRPDSITYEKLMTMKQFKVDRISINPQTMNDETLKAIGRHHSVQDVVDKFNLARELGFDNINMDIIIGLPEEKQHHIETTCKRIFELAPDSITVHGMSVKRASRLHEDFINGTKLEQESDEYINYAYKQVDNLAQSLNMVPYYMYRQKNMVGNRENIGYSKEDKIGVYNVQIIEEKQTIIAVGADAITKVVFNDENRIERSGNVKDVKLYIERIDELIENKIKLLNTLYE